MTITDGKRQILAFPLDGTRVAIGVLGEDGRMRTEYVSAAKAAAYIANNPAWRSVPDEAPASPSRPAWWRRLLRR